MSHYEIAEEFTKRAHAIPYPEMPQKPERGELTPRAYGTAIAKFEQARDRARAGREEYDRKNAECDAEFKAALAKEFNLTGHPKFDLLFRIAWDEGHSSGYSEVAGYAATLAELLQD